MTKIVLVEKTGNKKDLNAKDLSREILYKKCGFRKADGFEKRHSFEVKHEGIHSVEVWSRDSGRANTENKYDLPPPIDTALYFGTIAIVGVDEIDELTDLDKATWEKIYEKLFGGFDDIGDEDEDDDEEDELEHIPKELKTKVGGYMKDGFVVDANDSDDEEEGEGFGSEAFDDDDEESAEEDSDEDDSDDEDMLSELGSELAEEDYLYSDDEQ